jgi:hypothetical protein
MNNHSSVNDWIKIPVLTKPAVDALGQIESPFLTLVFVLQKPTAAVFFPVPDPWKEFDKKGANVELAHALTGRPHVCAARKGLRA